LGADGAGFGSLRRFGNLCMGGSNSQSEAVASEAKNTTLSTNSAPSCRDFQGAANKLICSKWDLSCIFLSK
jgi:hypothetical protein